MASLEEIRTDKTKAEGYYEEATKNLENFMKEENLEKFEKRWGTEAMKEEKKSLEAEKKKWGDQVEYLQKKLVEFGEGKGNEQIAKKIIFRSFHFVYFSFIQFRLFIYSFALSTTY